MCVCCVCVLCVCVLCVCVLCVCVCVCVFLVGGVLSVSVSFRFRLPTDGYDEDTNP